MAVALTTTVAGLATRRWRLLPVALMVALVHVWIAGRVADAVMAAGHVAALPARLQVAFVRELQPAPPPAPPAAAAAAPPPAARPSPAPAGRVTARRVAPLPAAPASAPPAPSVADPSPAVAPSSPEPSPAPVPASTEPPVFEIDASMAREPGDEGADASAPVPAAAAPASSPALPVLPPVAMAPAPPASDGPTPGTTADPAAGASAPGPAAAADAAPGDAAGTGDTLWPLSTRLSYTLTGHYRGPVEGSAQVEWLREGLRYQMHLDVVVGPGFAPLMSRRMSSQGTLGAEGLVPERYDELTQRAFAEPRHTTMRFEAADILLANGRRVPRPAAVQDTASQFGQVTWTFTREPQRLVAGAQLAIPLALPRRVDPWVFDVLPPETLYTPFGPVETFPLKPRRPERPGGELLAEMWIAPTLQYLPVRIRIHQDAETWIDLMVDSAPLQARR